MLTLGACPPESRGRADLKSNAIEIMFMHSIYVLHQKRYFIVSSDSVSDGLTPILS